MVYVQALQRVNSCPKNAHLFKLNRIVKWVRRVSYKTHYRPLQGKMKVLVVSDSAYRREDKAGHALRGGIICIAQDLPHSPGGTCHIIDMYSRKQRRVVRSTFSAEANSLIDACEIGKLLVLAITEVLSPIPLSAHDLLRMDERGTLLAEMHAVVDCKSVYDALTRKEIIAPTEQSLIMMLLAIRELSNHSVLRTLWWVCTEDMIADGLGKGAVSRTPLLQLAIQGMWIVKHQVAKHTEVFVPPEPNVVT